MAETNVQIYYHIKTWQKNDPFFQDKDDMQKVIREEIVNGEQGDAIGGNPDAIANLPMMQRTWIKNASGADVVIKFNSKDFLFENGKIYCVELGEAQFFRSAAKLQGHPFENSNETDWLSAGGVVKTFYW